MAEGWARTLHDERLSPRSAGTAPRPVDPRAIHVMREVGVDLSEHRSKRVAELSGIDFDWVITVCDGANEGCPVFAGTVRRLHADFDDPPRLAAGAVTEEEALSHYRRVRDEIRGFVATLPEALEAADAQRPEV